MDRYPGSKQALVDYDAPEEVSEDDELTSLLGPPYKMLNYGGEKTAFYSIGSLARALNRSPVTIRKWEANGTIPQPLWSAPGDTKALGGQVRLYIREQIAGLRKIAEEEGILHETWHAVHSTNFQARALELFLRLQEG
jgi:hypothetical protein